MLGMSHTGIFFSLVTYSSLPMDHLLLQYNGARPYYAIDANFFSWCFSSCSNLLKAFRDHHSIVKDILNFHTISFKNLCKLTTAFIVNMPTFKYLTTPLEYRFYCACAALTVDKLQ